jgi:hypothetical protein
MRESGLGPNAGGYGCTAASPSNAENTIELPFRVAVNLQRIDAADQIGVVANGSVEQVEDAPDRPSRRFAGTRRSAQLAGKPQSARVLGRQSPGHSFYAAPPHRTCDQDRDGRPLSGAGSLFEVNPTCAGAAEAISAPAGCVAAVALGNILLGCLGLAPIRRRTDIEP